MRKITVLALFMGVHTLWAQKVEVDEKAFEVFTYQEGDTTYTMQKYFIVFLKAGENRNQDSAAVMEIQKAHLAHIEWMANEGYVNMAGPFGDNGDVRGILVMRLNTMEQALSLVGQDPAVKAGRLVAEVHPWWAAQGSCLK